MSTASVVLLWLFVITLGTAFGAGVYEHRMVVPTWLTSAPGSGLHWNADAARRGDSGHRFWVFVTTGPLTLLALANLIMAWRSAGGVRGWWLAAALVALAERLLTFSYFIPTMVRLMRAPDSSQAVASARRWWRVNYMRHALVLVAWLASLRALVAIYTQRA